MGGIPKNYQSCAERYCDNKLKAERRNIMTREELKKIVEGITDEQLKSILDINTADIGKAKKDYDTIKSENETLKTDKKSMNEKITELTEKINLITRVSWKNFRRKSKKKKRLTKKLKPMQS